jgi:hypothetical protein
MQIFLVKVSKVLTTYKYYRSKQSYEYRGLYLQTILLVATSYEVKAH